MSDSFASIIQMLIQFSIIFYAYPSQIKQSWKEPRGFSIRAHALYTTGHVWTIIYFLNSGDYLNVLPQLFGVAFVLLNIIIVWKHRSIHNIYNNFFCSQPRLA